VDNPLFNYSLCLAFLPIGDVVEGFEMVQKSALKECIALYQYFEINYIRQKKRGKAAPSRKDPLFAIVQWNVYDRTMDGMPRTSNNVEGWHFGFAGMVFKHPHLLALIDAIKLEQSNTENNHVKLTTGISNHRAKKWVLFEERIVLIMKDYNIATMKDWLMSLAMLIQL
jgi:hypothetical protein